MGEAFQATVGTDFRITIPESTRKIAKIEQGSLVRMTVEKAGV